LQEGEARDFEPTNEQKVSDINDLGTYLLPRKKEASHCVQHKKRRSEGSKSTASGGKKGVVLKKNDPLRLNGKEGIVPADARKGEFH